MAKKKVEKKKLRAGKWTKWAIMGHGHLQDSGIIVWCYQKPNHTSHDIEMLPVFLEILWDTTSG